MYFPVPQHHMQMQSTEPKCDDHYHEATQDLLPTSPVTSFVAPNDLPENTEPSSKYNVDVAI